MTWTSAFAELNSSVVDYFGELVNYLSRDGLTAVTGISATLNRGGEDGLADFNMPTASVASPQFADSITDSDAVAWRISEVMQGFSDRTPCTLKRGDLWETVDLQGSTNGVWANITTGIYCLIEAQQSFEDFDEFNDLTTEYVVKMQYQTTPTQKMRLKWGARYLYISGIRPDLQHNQWMEMDTREDEA